MARPISKVAPDWWDYTTLDPQLLADAAKLTPNDLVQLVARRLRGRRSTTRSKSSTAPKRSNTSSAWQQATPDNPAGICGPIGPTEQLPLVARIVNALGLKLRRRPFLGHGRVDRERQAACRWIIRCRSPRPTWSCASTASPRAADAGGEHPFPARPRGVLAKLRPGPLRA